jgi:hypothetical protein
VSIGRGVPAAFQLPGRRDFPSRQAFQIFPMKLAPGRRIGIFTKLGIESLCRSTKRFFQKGIDKNGDL